MKIKGGMRAVNIKESHGEMEATVLNKPISFIAGVAFYLLMTYGWADQRHESDVILAEQLEWGYLNPLRGDKSPGAANLWGDRTRDVATGMLVRFNKGFASPPHIHNVSYRGIVIEGLVHNDDPNAEKLWMPPGSFWTQPAGENHITAADGNTNLIYLEIDRGPYLVQPAKEAFDNGERPVNIHVSNLVWSTLDVGGLQASSSSDTRSVEISKLWKSGPVSGSVIKLHAGFGGKLEAYANELRVVVISGRVDYTSESSKKPKHLLPGAYFSSSGRFDHHLSVENDSVIYIRSDGEFLISKI